jgi:hypothetical protein
MLGSIVGQGLGLSLFWPWGEGLANGVVREVLFTVFHFSACCRRHKM